jgi:hypothetical protein
VRANGPLFFLRQSELTPGTREHLETKGEARRHATVVPERGAVNTKGISVLKLALGDIIPGSFSRRGKPPWANPFPDVCT